MSPDDFVDVNCHSPPERKIALFRSIFQGRNDVYPRRFESRRTGKSGYAPACVNEWVRGVCDKRAVKCAECPHRRFLPVTDQVVRQHLRGEDERGRDFVMGVYPMLLDETCCFLAADFDKSSWQEDSATFLDVCRDLGVPALLERSRSGEGGHVWLLLDEPMPAAMVRSLGCHILTLAMQRRPDVGFDSYDRFFPNQDTLPRGGFGNLIALPLQKRPRERGNTLFLDRNFSPHEDQWEILAGQPRLRREDVERIVADAGAKGQVVGLRLSLPDLDGDEAEAPWTARPSRRRKAPKLIGPFPDRLELVLDDQIYIARSDLTPELRNRLIRLAAFQNPEFYRAQAMRLPTYEKPRIIACAEDYPKHVGLPRGCLEDVINLLGDLNIEPIVQDRRFAGQPLDVSFQGELRPEQLSAARALLDHDTGVLAATTAFGKTVLASWLIAQRGVNTLVLVHRRQLMEQWIERLAMFLDIPRASIGQIGGGRKRPGGLIDIGIIQSLVHKGVVSDRVAEYGYLIVDECHHLSARSFELVARRSKARFVTGLSATVTRKDGHHPIIFMQCGPVRYQVDAKSQAKARPFSHKVLVRPTGFQSHRTGEEDARVQFQELCAELIVDDARNQMICEDVLKLLAEGRFPVLLSQRVEHIESLARRLSPDVERLIVLRGGMSRKERAAAMERLQEAVDGEPRVLLATGHYIGEGFDDPRLDTLLLTMPVSWRGTVAQYAGRLHRLHDGKREVRIYDYADLNVPMLARMFDRRCRGYEAIGYTIELPASAAPGWPLDVPLPIDSKWKQDHATTVQRLIRDGVDASLADLFVKSTESGQGEDNSGRSSSPGPRVRGVGRARSASEAFLYRRLETIPETAGQFKLNAELPISFDQRSKMEVDFLCEALRLVIELDGDQHLASPAAYRRDRRKDTLLQENGYFVLRFLASDLGTHLDDIVDSILRAMAHRTSVLRAHPSSP